MSNAIDKILANTLQQFAAQIEEEAKQYLGETGLGHLTPHTEVIQTPTGRGIVFLVPGYTVFVEHGVKGTENTPQGAEDSPFTYKHMGLSTEMVDSLRSWVGRKGLTPKTKPSSLQNTNRRQSLKQSDPKTAMAFALGKSIKKKGLSAKKVFAQTLSDAHLQTLADDIATQLQKEITVLLGSV